MATRSRYSPEALMPKVGQGKSAKHFPYTPAGYKAAEKAKKAAKKGKAKGK